MLPQAARPGEGIPFNKLSPLTPEHRLAAVFALPAKNGRLDDWFVLTVTRQGMVKKSALAELPGPSAHTFTLVKVNSGDRLGWVHLTNGKAEVLLATADGMAIRFSEEEVRPMGLVAAGVMGIRLQAKDEVVGAELAPARGEVFMIATDGSAKRLASAQFPKQGRYGQGVIAWKLPRGVRVTGLAVGKGTTRATLFLKELAPKAIRLDEAPLQGRAARGKLILELKPSDRVMGLAVPREAVRLPEKDTQNEGKAKRTAGRSGSRKAAPKP
jgi:DNA gyrase subunit A